MKRTTCIRAAGALAALALALPASAVAVPTVTSVDAKLDAAGVTFLTDATGAGLTSQVRSVVSADGYALGLAETNGVTGGGVLDYSALPADYRAPMTPAEKLAYPAAQTDVQAHATCAGVAALSAAGNILAWQGRDPYYAYLPWQKTSAGLGDDPGKWIPVVRFATGVDLFAVTDFRRACTDLGGTYQAADTSSSIADTLIANAVAPIRRARDASDRAAATARDAQRAARDAQRLAEAAYQALFTKPIELTLAAKRFAPASGVVMVTGSPTDPVHVTLELARRKARKLGLVDPVLAEADGEIGENGAVLLTLKPEPGVLKALTTVKVRGARGRARARAARGSLPATVHAVSGGNEDSAKAVLVR